MFLNNRTNVAIAAGVFLLAGIGAAAWFHNAQSQPAPVSVVGLAPAPAPVSEAVPAPGEYSQPGLNTYAAALPATSSAGGYYPSIPPPAYISQPPPPPAAPEPVVNQESVSQDSAVQYDSAGPYTGEVRTSAPRYYRARHHGRSKKHSIEIVAGSAAAGAAIGAIAGGGPGAAIGAISGGGAGFIYDRLTHNH